MSEKNHHRNKGLLESLSTLASTIIAITHTRLNLLSNDIEMERAHALTLLALSVAALLFLGIGVVLATILLVVMFWEPYRLLILGSLAIFFTAAGIATWWFAAYKTRTKPKLFSASLSELSKDQQLLTSGSSR